MFLYINLYIFFSKKYLIYNIKKLKLNGGARPAWLLIASPLSLSENKKKLEVWIKNIKNKKYRKKFPIRNEGWRQVVYVLVVARRGESSARLPTMLMYFLFLDRQLCYVDCFFFFCLMLIVE